MRIIHLLYDLKYGGIQTLSVNIMNEQVSLGHEVTLLILNRDVEEPLLKMLRPEIKVFCIGRKYQSKNIYYIMKLNWFLAVHKFDILHTSNCRFSRMIFLPIPQSKMCTTMHDMCRGAMNDKYLYKYKNIVAISHSVQNDIFRKYALKSTVIYNGIMPYCFETKKRKYNTDGKFHIVQVGRLEAHKKGNDLLIDAVYMLKKNGYDDIVVDFIGDGQSRLFLEEKVANLGMTSNFVFLGARNQKYIAENLGRYDLFVQPSRIEGFGLTVAEAMAAKIPVLVSDNQGPMEIIDNGKYGAFFETDSVQNFANKIRQIKMEGVNQAFLQEAFERVVQEFDVKKTAQRYCEYYKSLN